MEQTTTATTSSNNTTSRSRIPPTLQAVFLASNRGKEVNKPPPDKAASKVFFTNWFMQRKTASGKQLKSSSSSSSHHHRPAIPGLSIETTSRIPRQPATNVQLLSPQVYLDAMLRSRGYSTQRFKTLQTSYHNAPTALQQASYSVYMIGLVRTGDAETLQKVMSCGISPNPCNSFGESLVHNVCRRGDDALLQIFVQNGCALAVCDDYGRTPLHDACWCAEPAFDVVKRILRTDRRLFHMIDSRERLPLGYVRQPDWPVWVEFLAAHQDEFWPPRLSVEGEEPPPRLTQHGPNSRPLPNPPKALSVELAAMVASGRMKPAEALFLHAEQQQQQQQQQQRNGGGGATATTLGESSDDEEDESDYDDDEEDSDDYDSDDDYYDSDEDDDSLFDEEMEVLLDHMSHIQRPTTLARGTCASAV